MSQSQVFNNGNFQNATINQVAAERIENSLNQFNGSAAPSELKEAMAALHAGVKQLTDQLATKGTDTTEIVEDLEDFTAQATKPKPSGKVLAVTGKGLIDAAKNIAELVAPVTTAVNFALKLMGLPSI